MAESLRPRLPQLDRHRVGIDWVIAGGESGLLARSVHPGWIRSLRDQCAAAGIPFFFKQWGEWRPAPEIISAAGSMFHCFADGCGCSAWARATPAMCSTGVKHEAFPIPRALAIGSQLDITVDRATLFPHP
nr:phage Gp37/Gp68 family protein [Burkholderia glumae]